MTSNMQINKLIKLVNKDSRVNTLYFYGSRAVGTYTKNSDYDFGLLLFNNVNDPMLEAIYNSKLSEIFGNVKAQIFVINNKSPLFRHSVIAPRKILVCKDHNLRADFEVQTYNEYFERLPYIQQTYKSAIKRAKNNVK